MASPEMAERKIHSMTLEQAEKRLDEAGFQGSGCRLSMLFGRTGSVQQGGPKGLQFIHCWNPEPRVWSCEINNDDGQIFRFNVRAD